VVGFVIVTLVSAINLSKGENKMKRLVPVLFLLIALPVSAFADVGHSQEGKFTRHYAGSLFEVTEKGRYSVEMLVIGNELKTGMNAVDVIVHDESDADVMGAEITLTPWMPDMGHGVKEVPKVTERGGGLYSIENVEISMPGRWELRVKVKKGKTKDEVVFEFPDVHPAGMMHEHKPTAAEVPSDVNMSRIVESEAGAFRVSYMSDSEPVPINKVHGWRLYIETASGEPVTDAEISIDGDMPEHGHGMPTKPRVARNLGGGVYAVEGMKFQMPGWWVVHFRISSGGTEDTATFNLILR
jgi:hypothetical protein